MRHNRSQTKQRRSHHGLKSPNLAVCVNCGTHHRPHHMCLGCGFYNGRQVLDLTAEKEKREARLKAKREAIAGAQADAVADSAATPADESTPAQEPQAVTAEDSKKK